MKKTSKISKIKRLLESGKSITSIQAFEKFKATRLSGIIFELRSQGMEIETIPEKGEDCTYARYKLLKKEA